MRVDERQRGVDFGYGGWVRERVWSKADRSDLRMIYARLALQGGRFRVSEVYFAPPFDPLQLRQFRPASLEAAVNSGLSDDQRREFLDDTRLPGPLLEVAASYFATQWGSTERDRSHPNMPWVARMQWSQIDRIGEPKAHLLEPSFLVDQQREAPDLKLDLPAEGTRPYPDEFFRRVAEIYAYLAERYKDPAPRIADANGIAEVTKVHRWVKRSRALGYLPPASQGRRG